MSQEIYKNPKDQANVLIKDSSSPTGYRQTRMGALRRYKNTIEPIDNFLREVDAVEGEKPNPIKEIKKAYGDEAAKKPVLTDKARAFYTDEEIAKFSDKDIDLINDFLGRFNNPKPRK